MYDQGVITRLCNILDLAREARGYRKVRASGSSACTSATLVTERIHTFATIGTDLGPRS